MARQVGADGLALQRRMARPLLVVGDRLRMIRGRIGFHWIVELKNMGQSAGEINSLRILVGGNAVVPAALEPTTDYWTRVMRSLDPPVGILEVEGQVIRPPFAISPGEIVRLFDAKLQGDVELLHAAMRTLAVDIEYTSPWRERYSVLHSLRTGDV